jgi:hypothetical protein
MDVYFQPLVYDLLDMFENGVRTYDSLKGEFFQLRAVVLWTITDFPGLGYASGSSHVVKQLVLIASLIHVQCNLVMVAKLAIWVIEDSCMKTIHLGLMLINFVILSLGQHLLYIQERKF